MYVTYGVNNLYLMFKAFDLESNNHNEGHKDCQICIGVIIEYLVGYKN